MELSDRKLKILLAVINNYIQYAEPVSSKVLCDILDISISSATIRNELAELTELGLLEQPHTSSGRIPSHLGYRLYINKLMSKYYLSQKTKNYIDSALANIKEPEQLLKNASQLLASLTNFAVISTNICSDNKHIKNIKLIQIGNYTAMIILTTSSGIIKNRLFRCDFLLTSEILEKINNALNEKFKNVLLSEVTPAYIQTVAVSMREFAFFMSDALNALLEVSEVASKTDFYFNGQTNLLLIPEFDQESAIKLMNFFNYYDNINDLFLFSDRKTNVFIGRETHHEELNESSVIVTKYIVSGENYGAIGLVGPTRMNYNKMIASIEYIASCLGGILNNIINLE